MMVDRIDAGIFITLDESDQAVLDDFGLVTIRDTLQGFFESRKRIAQQNEMRKLYEGFGKLNTKDQHSVRTIIASASPGSGIGTLPGSGAEGNTNFQIESATGTKS